MRVYSYVVKHDYGFAPNPFGGVLTLATCKPKIRRHAKVNVWIIGTGSSKSIGSGKLIFAGQVAEVISMTEYGSSGKYKFKIPTNGAEKWRRRGDNIYYLSNNQWIQRKNSFHNLKDKERDLSSKNVLICQTFWYFGSSALSLPSEFMSLVKTGPGHKHNEENQEVPAFLLWLEQHPRGLIGQPSSISTQSSLNSNEYHALKPRRKTCA